MFCMQITVFAQQSIDSLLLQLQYTKDPSLRIELLSSIADYYYVRLRDNVNSEKFLLEAKDIAEKEDNKGLLIFTYNNLGVLYRNLSRYAESLNYHNEAYGIAVAVNDKKQQTKTLNSIGVVYRRLDDHSKAAEYHLSALKIAEEISDTFSISVSYNSLGNIYSLNGQYKDALSYFFKALTLSENQKNKLGQAINYNNIGEVYEFSGDYEKAKEFYSKSLEINKELNNEKGISICFNALGKIFLYTGYPRTAYKYFLDAADIDKKIGDRKFIADSYINLGRALVKLKRYDDAKQCINQGITIAENIKSKVHLQIAFEELSTICKEKNDYRTALLLYQKSNAYKDSILNEKNARHLATIQALYENDKKEKEIKILKQTNEIKEKEYKRQRFFNYSLLIGLLLCIVIAFSIYSALVTKKRANILLSNQKNEIAKQKEKIEKQQVYIELKNKNLEEAYQIIENYIEKITDSIRYAEQIQKSIFPDIEAIKATFKDTFVFYKPKDIVSGDFYWCLVKGDKVFIALADCTGHGVPGAFMSIIGIDLLNQAVNQMGYKDTNVVLDYLNHELREKLRKGKEELILKDSMDIAFCIIDKKESVIHYSGALISLIIVKNDEVKEIKPNHASLGTSRSLFNREFVSHSIKLETDSWVYLSTDGFVDQFGGMHQKKYMRSRFVELLISINNLCGEEQKNELEEQFNRWRGGNDQIDDVLVWGIKI